MTVLTIGNLDVVVDSIRKSEIDPSSIVIARKSASVLLSMLVAELHAYGDVQVHACYRVCHHTLTQDVYCLRVAML